MTSKGTNGGASPTAADQPPPPSELAQIGIALVGTFVAARILSAISRLATVFAAPACGLYLFTTCPTNDSFDGKVELKRVLRGDKLPDDNPNKPKGFFDKLGAKISASLEAEAAALAGCKIEIMDLYGIVKVASIRHPLTNTSYFWLGAINKWRYIMARDAPSSQGSSRLKRE